jgi:hypothetical protein
VSKGGRKEERIALTANTLKYIHSKGIAWFWNRLDDNTRTAKIMKMTGMVCFFLTFFIRASFLGILQIALVPASHTTFHSIETHRMVVIVTQWLLSCTMPGFACRGAMPPCRHASVAISSVDGRRPLAGTKKSSRNGQISK